MEYTETIRAGVNLFTDIIDELNEEPSKQAYAEALPEIEKRIKTLNGKDSVQKKYAHALYKGFEGARDYNQKVAVVFAKNFLKEVTENFKYFDGKDQATHLMNSFEIKKGINLKAPDLKATKLEHDFKEKHRFGWWDRLCVNWKHSDFIYKTGQQISSSPQDFVDMMREIEVAQYPETDSMILNYVENINTSLTDHKDSLRGKKRKTTDYFWNNTFDDYQLVNQRIRSKTAERVNHFGWSVGESKIVRACDKVSSSLSDLTMT